MDIRTKIVELIEDPDGMERLYREGKQSFVAAYGDVLAERPDSLLLRAWKARLEYASAAAKKLTGIDLLLMVLLCLAAGCLYKVPDWSLVDSFEYIPRYVALIPFAAMAAFTLHMRGWPRAGAGIALGVAAVLAGYMHLVPSDWEDAYTLSCVHVPFFLWCVYGLVRMGRDWRSAGARIEYIRFFGELVIHAGLLFIGGGILLLLTAGLFDLLGLPTYWVFDYVAIYGLASIPLVAAWATDTYSAARRIVPLMARIFAPLLLVLIVAYMVALAWNLGELFRDRDTLLMYNVLLLSVLATAVFTLTGRREHGESAVANSIIFWMLAATLVLDVIGVCAIGWRIYEYGGITANRLAVLGSNLAVFGNLAVLCLGYLRHWRGRASLDDVERGLAAYLPVYSAWTAFVIFILPWIFRY
ncbi:hypothetical protein [Salidesulfovibrio onnuriiensis]|uniref:hypothetical protein n=1 Tax=Salidesulfovibrio onnuriiensis TaxID=2583823 RepID=UPI0011C9E226|nr:hypothetical protein [Salidesulfovibrio onnuriiensis]